MHATSLVDRVLLKSELDGTDKTIDLWSCSANNALWAWDMSHSKRPCRSTRSVLLVGVELERGYVMVHTVHDTFKHLLNLADSIGTWCAHYSRDWSSNLKSSIPLGLYNKQPNGFVSRSKENWRDVNSKQYLSACRFWLWTPRKWLGHCLYMKSYFTWSHWEDIRLLNVYALATSCQCINIVLLTKNKSLYMTKLKHLYYRWP